MCKSKIHSGFKTGIVSPQHYELYGSYRGTLMEGVYPSPSEKRRRRRVGTRKKSERSEELEAEGKWKKLAGPANIFIHFIIIFSP